MTEYAYSYALDDRYLDASFSLLEVMGKETADIIKRIADKNGHLSVWVSKIAIVWPRIAADIPDEEIKARFAPFIKEVLHDANLVETPVPVYVHRIDKEEGDPFPITRIEVTFNAQ